MNDLSAVPTAAQAIADTETSPSRHGDGGQSPAGAAQAHARRAARTPPPTTSASLVREISQLLTYEVTRDLAMETIAIKTPIAPMKCRRCCRARSLSGVDPARRQRLPGRHARPVPAARVAISGLYRDPETLEPIEYYFKMPEDIARAHGDRGGPDAGHRQHRHRGAEPAAGGRRDDHDSALGLTALLAGGPLIAARGAPRTWRSCTAAIDEQPERARLHPAGPRRRRRPALRHEVMDDAGHQPPAKRRAAFDRRTRR